MERGRGRGKKKECIDEGIEKEKRKKRESEPPEVSKRRRKRRRREEQMKERMDDWDWMVRAEESGVSLEARGDNERRRRRWGEWSSRNHTTEDNQKKIATRGRRIVDNWTGESDRRRIVELVDFQVFFRLSFVVAAAAAAASVWPWHPFWLLSDTLVESKEKAAVRPKRERRRSHFSVRCLSAEFAPAQSDDHRWKKAGLDVISLSLFRRVFNPCDTDDDYLLID
ncbi:hypothetical protein ASPWEDRAFT_30786 [Aspergillus wentii DTO 134E9]|uniref:Uncharacterized protein n=1 Tax=Aspergillus wentii DTO 134E9 TaxID=1073089 RepID=A0A1L9RAB5_ASPWE|nr:uncharacterized protein ASPWEDRAFT_30786 [Aspergillus wentii DTO 134E9]OJJ31813.1 hypothetical protein ASPWEDRAFT_30786 [Aspergillus wentii DTO 134E9]